MSRISDKGQQSLKNIEESLRQLQRNIATPVNRSRPNSSNAPLVAVPLVSQQEPSAGAPLSAAAASIISSIDSFDLFAAAAGNRPAAVAQRAAPAMSGELRARPSISSSTPIATSSSCAIGSDDVIPSDAPEMSDEVMAGGDAQYHGSRVIPLRGKHEGPNSNMTLWRSGEMFAKSARRATQFLYFELLRQTLEEQTGLL